MEPNMLVIVLDPNDSQLGDIRETSEDGPTFGIVRDVLDESGRYLDFRCTVKLDKGDSVIQVGQMLPLLKLPEEDAQLTPSEAFVKWAPEIVKRQMIVHLLQAQRDFLRLMRIEA